MRDYAEIEHLLQLDLQAYRNDPGFIASDTTIKAAFAASLANSFYKKLCPNGNSDEADRCALEKFKAINDSLPTEPFRFQADSEVESCFWDYLRDNFNRCLDFKIEGSHNFGLEYIRENMLPGPGAAQESDATSFHTKLFEGPMSHTHDYLITLYRAAISESGFWADAEHFRFLKFPFVKVDGCKVFFVPKNAEISRVCSTQANLNMLVQKACGSFIEERFGQSFSIYLDRQPEINRELARLGSLNGTYGTMDLVSASDYITKSMIFALMENSPLKTMLFLTRSDRTVLPDGSMLTLNMMSTMGNGFTFPLQTLLFASVVRSCYQLLGIRERTPDNCFGANYGVFGDDIIVRREAYDFVARMLHKLGFVVNESKSFNSGPFRESCGEDFHNGINIRGVYIRSLETRQQVYSAINRLTNWSAASGILLYHVISRLRSYVRFLPIPRSESEDAGIRVPLSLTSGKLIYKSDYQSYWYSYRKYKPIKKELKIAEPDNVLCDEDGYLPHVNPFGICLARLGGYIRKPDISYTDTGCHGFDQATFISPRKRIGERVRYKIVSGTIPYWDWIGNQSTTFMDFQKRDPHDRVSQDRWETILVALA